MDAGPDAIDVTSTTDVLATDAARDTSDSSAAPDAADAFDATDAVALPDTPDAPMDSTIALDSAPLDSGPIDVIAEPLPPPTSCLEIKTRTPSSANGVYMIAPGGSPFAAFCEMTLDGGGWTAFYAGLNGSPNTFAHFDTATTSCTDPMNHCLRPVPSGVTTSNEFAASCAGVVVKFHVGPAILNYLQRGTQGGWQLLTGVVAVAGSPDVTFARSMWTGASSNQGWILSDIDPTGPGSPTTHTFANGYSVNANWDYCRGVHDTTAPVLLFYR